MTSSVISYRVHIRHTETGAVTVLEGAFSAEDSRRLRAYLLEVELLERTRFIAGGMQNRWRIEADGQGSFVPPELPSDADLAEFLHRLRPIILDDEQTSFFSVAAVVGRELRHDYFRWRLRRLRRQYRADDMQRLYRIYSNDVWVNCDATLKLWLNGFEYHRDSEKAQVLNEASRGLPLDIQKAIFIDMLATKSMAAMNLGRIDRTGVSHRLELERWASCGSLLRRCCT